MPAPALLNKQPIFTATPIIVSLGTDLTRNIGDTYQTNTVTSIYTDSTTYGSLISKITVNANAVLGTVVSNKRIDLYIYNPDEGSFYLYASKYMTGDNSIAVADTIPSVVFEFPTGLILSPGKGLGLSTTENYSNSGNQGDLVSVVIEGGTYDQPA